MGINLTSRGNGDLCYRYKPHTFDEMVGQSSTVKSVRTAVVTKNSSQCYLFHGESGCGKSTLAYIMALSLNCMNQKDNGNPCLECKNCTDIMNNKSVDYKEINAAEAKGINEVRSIIDDLKLSPMFGKVKIYVLNEAHGMTKAAQDALLQDMDNMPEDAYIILTSTEPSKITGPLRYRCESYKFTKITEGYASDLIDYICTIEEGIITDRVKDLIVEKTEKRPRNILKVLQIVINIGLGDEKTLLEAIEDSDNNGSIADLCKAIQNKKSWPEIMTIYKKLDLSPESIYRIMGSWFRSSLERAHYPSNASKDYNALLHFINDLPVTIKTDSSVVASIYGAFKAYNGM